MPVDLGNLGNGNNSEEREPIEVECAFRVIFRPGGIVQASPDIDTPLIPAREATVEDMEMGCHKVGSDIQAQKIAQVTQMQMMQMASAAQQQQESQNLAQKLNL